MTMTMAMMRKFLLLVCALLVSTAAGAQTVGFSDDFERPDGPASGWTVHSGQWDVIGGKLGQNAAEGWVWAADPPAYFRGDLAVSFQIEFTSTPADGLGRHGGIMFFASHATVRGGGNTGYTLDWIDRADDHGLRLIRWQPDGSFEVLVNGTPDLAEPPEVWEILVDGDDIIVSGDGEVAIEVTDGTYREGFFGLWAFSNGTDFLVDNVVVEGERAGVVPCFSAAPLTGPEPLEVTFDASCSTGDVASYAWEFGDGTEGEGVTVAHTFEFADTYTVTLHVTDAAGNTESTTLSVTVTPAVDIENEFFADFEDGDGAPEDWTVQSGLWDVVDGRLTAFSSGENWIWAGDSPYVFSGTLEISFEFEFLAVPGDDVGRHGGMMLCADPATDRYSSSGYTIDWIDRASDHGVRVLRWDSGGFTSLQASTPDVTEPPTEWTISVTPELFQVYGDGELLAEIHDATYRTGSFGFWIYSNGQEVAIDNVRIEPPVSEAVTFRRGDVDNNGLLEVTDPVNNLAFQFLGTIVPTCLDALDWDDSGTIDLTDPIGNLSRQFLGGAPAAPPGSDVCGVDPTEDALTCEASTACAP